MRKLLHKWRRGVLIGFGAVILSTLGIQASDELSGVASRLSGLVIESETSLCSEYAVPILFGTHTICMDTYEASPAKDCVYTAVGSELQTQTNLTVGDCSAVSAPNVMPWSFVTYTQAEQLCARSGKRLPTSEEWYKVALGTADVAACFAGSAEKASLTGSVSCVTPTMVYDMVGNVWEWTADTITNGVYKERTLPDSGYVDLVDSNGVVVESAARPSQSFGEDYAWVNKSGVRGVLRGGFYGSSKDGGIFSQNLSVELDFASAGIGFRCVEDLR